MFAGINYILGIEVECLSNPCQNNGNCIELINKCSCDCLPGYRGPQCQLGNYIGTNAQVASLQSNLLSIAGIDECMSHPCRCIYICTCMLDEF